MLRNGDVSSSASSDDLLPREFRNSSSAVLVVLEVVFVPPGLLVHFLPRLPFDPRVLRRLSALLLCIGSPALVQLPSSTSLGRTLVRPWLSQVCRCSSASLEPHSRLQLHCAWPCHQAQAGVVHRIRRDLDHLFSFGVTRPVCSDRVSVSCDVRQHSSHPRISRTTLGSGNVSARAPFFFLPSARGLSQVVSVSFCQDGPGGSRALQTAECSSSRVPWQFGSRLVPVDIPVTGCTCSCCGPWWFFRVKNVHIFSCAMSKLRVLSRIIVIIWMASLSWMILLPPQGLRVVIAPESAPFFTDRICRVCIRHLEVLFHLAAICSLELDISAYSAVS